MGASDRHHEVLVEQMRTVQAGWQPAPVGAIGHHRDVQVAPLNVLDQCRSLCLDGIVGVHAADHVGQIAAPSVAKRNGTIRPLMP